MKRENGMTKKIIIGIFPVIVGGFIYMTYRPDNLIMFGWLAEIGLLDLVYILRSNHHVQNLVAPSWVTYSLPDAFWLFSFNYILLTLWNFEINRQSGFWVLLAPTIGLSSEIGQYFNIIPGTFDLVDLVFLFVAALIPLLFLNNLKTKKIRLT